MINKVILLGYLGTDPEIRTLPSGGRVANFTLATSEAWKAEDGSKKERTEWHKVVIFQDAIISLVERCLRKGSKLYVEGSIKTRKYTNNSGEEKYIIEIVVRSPADKIRILDNRNNDRDLFGNSNNDVSQDAIVNGNIRDDEIPF